MRLLRLRLAKIIFIMNFQQINYILAVDLHKNFAVAADKCFVTQPTLSMMIMKLEDELGVKIFDRSKKPVVTTRIGKKVIIQAKRIQAESSRLKEMIMEESGEVSGELKIGIIPTLAPYLLPLFLKQFSLTNPSVKLTIVENITEIISAKLNSGELDIGILATPLLNDSLNEKILFYEKFFLYVSDGSLIAGKNYILPKDIDLNELWLLEEGHCMRAQVLNLCELKKQKDINGTLNYEAGSIETLKNIVDRNRGMTIIPELAAMDFNKNDRKRLIPFKPPEPAREISIVTHKGFIRTKFAEALKNCIIEVIPGCMKLNKKMRIMEIT